MRFRKLLSAYKCLKVGFRHSRSACQGVTCVTNLSQESTLILDSTLGIATISRGGNVNCPKCKAECVKQTSVNTWCEFYLCEKCQLVYTVTRECKLCGGEHVGTHKLRDGERVERWYFVKEQCKAKLGSVGVNVSYE